MLTYLNYPLGSSAGLQVKCESTDVIAVDIGGTKIAAARVSALGRCLSHQRIDTPARAGKTAMLEAICQLVNALNPDKAVSAVGIGTAGVVNSHTGEVIASGESIADWANTPLAQEVKTRCAVSVVRVVNDVHAHALGECAFGVGRDYASVLVLAVGTGIGGCWIHKGHAHIGAHHVAGHFGELPTAFAREIDAPSDRLEDLASGTAILQHYHRLGGSLSVTRTQEVMTRCTEDKIAQRICQVSAKAIGQVLAGLANAFDPEVIIYAGGLADAPEIWWQEIDAALRLDVLPPLRQLPLLKSKLGADAPLLGAASLVLA